VGTSFFGGGVSNDIIVQGDFLAGAYSAPTLTVPGGGGVDIITFPASGVYLLVGQIYSYSGSLNHVNIWSYCTNVGVSTVSSSANGSYVTSSYYVPTFAIVSVSADATISFPGEFTSPSLVSLYGSVWANSYCLQLTIVRLS